MLTSNEVKAICFSENNFNASKILPAHIEITEIQNMHPIFGLDFFNQIKFSNASSTPGELYLLKLKLHKPFAYFVKYHVLPDMHLQDTNKGIQSPFSEHSQRGSIAELNYKRDIAYKMAESFMTDALLYLENNKEKFTLYKQEDNVKTKISRAGGFLFGKKVANLSDSDEYYRANQNQ